MLTPKAQISLRFALRPAVIEIQACRKSEMHRMIPEWPHAHNFQKEPVYTELSPEAQITLRFAPRRAVFDIQACQKSEMHRMIPEWHQALNY